MRVFLLCLLLFCSAARAQQAAVRMFTNDSLPSPKLQNWQFHEGDSAAWAAPAYNDSSWITIDPALTMSRTPANNAQRFKGIGWLRFHFIIDSTLINTPLAFELSHGGASEVYMDGKKLTSYGLINGPDSSEYYNPQNVPFLFVLTQPGAHVMAVRYANYDAIKDFEVHHKPFAGFHMQLANGNPAVSNLHAQDVSTSSLLIFMFGIFIALSFIHLLMFLYYRAERSNLHFSIFCLCLAVLFLIPYLNNFISDTSVQLVNTYAILVAIAAACMSLSGFVNALFSKSKLRFRIIVVLSVISLVLFLFGVSYSFIILICITSLEAIVLISRAIFRRIPGARILASGILFFAIFIFALTLLLIVTGIHNFETDGNNKGIVILVIGGILAILSVPLSISVYLAWSFATTNRNLQVQLQEVQRLSDHALLQEQEKQQLLESRKEELEKEVLMRTEQVVAQKQEIEQQHASLKIEKKKSDDLLMNILPGEVADELKQTGASAARFFNNVTVLFTDFVDFTIAGERMSPQELVDELHNCFKAFDNIISQHNIEKIKTIGDAYLAVCGLPAAQPDHAEKMVRAALEITRFMAERKQQLGDKTFDIRAGIHSGSVVAGIVGVKKFAYDIWGDTVNTAARMEQNSQAGKINISQVTYELIKDKFTCTYRGEIAAKNKGQMAMYFVEE